MEKTETRGAPPLYRDIAERTQGELYIGVVGPVRAGKSTFITNFMEKLVLPRIPPGPRRERIRDELPQASAGRTIMTTQPRFVPGEGAANVALEGNTAMRVRMVDSVGYLIPGALGTQEGGEARMVSTPWQDGDMPFEEAARLGTQKVMRDHATIGVVVTTDGTVSELPRSAYEQAEEQIVAELRGLGKPFCVVLNSATPEASEARALRETLSKKYDAPVTLLSCRDMDTHDIGEVLSGVLSDFPLREVFFSPPDWLFALEDDHWLVKDVLASVRGAGDKLSRMRDRAVLAGAFGDSETLLPPRELAALPGEGRISCALPLRDGLFNRVLSQQCGADVADDAHLLALMTELVKKGRAYDRVASAMDAAQQTGYGLVSPAFADIGLTEPELTKQGARYGVRVTASAPVLHIVRTDVETEVAPLLGSQAQAEEFSSYLSNTMQTDAEALWDANFFGRPLRDVVRDSLSAKLAQMPPDAQEKVRLALGKMLNEGNGGMICILL